MEAKVIERRSSGFVLWHGIVGGIITGIIFFIYQMYASVAIFGNAYVYP